MADDGALNGPASETDSLLGTVERAHSHQQWGSNVERSVWFRYSSYVYDVAKDAFKSIWINVPLALVFASLGVAAHTLGWHTIMILIFNLLAILPLSALVSSSSEALSNYVGELWGGLVNATFGNAVELIVCPP
jgi:hypothetical protein